MADSTGVITIKEAVLSILNVAERPTSDYKRYTQMLLEGITELNLYVRSSPKQEKITMTNGWIDLPSDFIDLISVGVHLNGQVFTFTRNDKIIITTSEEGGVEYQDELIGEGVAIDNGQIVGSGARGGKNEYYYRWDKRGRRIYVAGFPDQTVFLTYLSSGVDIDSTTYVERAVLPCLTAYVLWTAMKYKQDVPANQKQMLEHYFHQERRKLRYLNAPTADQWADKIMSSYKMAVRR
jgi:hypothetical protein